MISVTAGSPGLIILGLWVCPTLPYLTTLSVTQTYG